MKTNRLVRKSQPPSDGTRLEGQHDETQTIKDRKAKQGKEGRKEGRKEKFAISDFSVIKLYNLRLMLGEATRCTFF